MDHRLRRAARPLIEPARAVRRGWEGAAARRAARATLRDRGDWSFGDAHRARSGTSILAVRDRHSGTGAYLKLSATPDGGVMLARERRALEQLHADSRLAGLHSLIPRALDGGRTGRWTFLLQSALPGAVATSMLADGDSRAQLLREASIFATRLHRSSAVARKADVADLDRWVNQPIAIGARLLPRAADRLATIGSGLSGSLAVTQSIGWIHGDFWAGNLLVAPSGAIGGVIDWDSAEEGSLASHDLLHLVLFARRARGRTEIGTELCRALDGDAGWDESEAPIVDAAAGCVSVTAAAEPLRTALTLYWLRLVAVNYARQPRMTASRRWVRDNVDAVADRL